MGEAAGEAVWVGLRVTSDSYLPKKNMRLYLMTMMMKLLRMMPEKVLQVAVVYADEHEGLDVISKEYAMKIPKMI